MSQTTHKYLNFTFLVILLSFLSATIHFGKYNTNIVNFGDSAGYYVYLPALFIHNDFGFVEDVMGDGSGDYSGKFVGPVVNKYTCGVAVLQLPFFGLGHVVAGLTGAKQDGYSYPYLLFLMIGVVFYVMLGLYFLSRVLLRLFDEKVVILLIVSIALATNLFYFTTYNNQMAHAYSFFLVAAMMYFTINWYENPTWKNAFLVGLTSGLIALIRPVDILILTVPVLYGITSWEDFKNRFKFIGLHWKKYLFAIIVFGMCAIPQFLYWKEVTGHWYYYSYRTEGFDFHNSHVLDGFIDGKNGWLRYTPIMFFSLIGMFYLVKNRKWLWPILLFFPLFVFITYSWHNWFYINSFGSRPLVGSYALLSIPLGYFVSSSFKRKGTKILVILLFSGFIVLNIFQTFQETWGVSRSEYASNAYYFKSFGKTKMDYEMLSTYETNVSQPYHTDCKKILVKNNFLDSTTINMEREIFHSSPYAVRLNKAYSKLELLHQRVKNLGVEGGQYLKISAYCYATKHVRSWFQQGILVAHVEKDGKPRRWNQMWINNKILAEKSGFSLWSNNINEWGEVRFYYKIPSNVKEDEYLKVFIDNYSDSDLLVDDIQIEICQSI